MISPEICRRHPPGPILVLTFFRLVLVPGTIEIFLGYVASTLHQEQADKEIWVKIGTDACLRGLPFANCFIRTIKIFSEEK